MPSNDATTDVVANGHIQPADAHCGAIVILDAGAQYGKVIDRRIRELKVESDIRPLDTPAQELAQYKAIIISGGPQSVTGPLAPRYDPAIFSLNKPILGVCYGQQLINHVFHGTVVKKLVREDGVFDIRVTAPASLLYRGFSQEKLQKLQVLLTHGDSVEQVADGFTVTAMSDDGIIASMEDARRQIYAVQYHPEVDLTPDGKLIYENFIQHVAHIPQNFTLHSRLDTAVKQIQHDVGPTNKVLCLLSGGVDSTVCAALLRRALDKERIYAIHIDNGFMRKDESTKVELALKALDINLTVRHDAEEFYNATTLVHSIGANRKDEANEATLLLKQTCNPEHKRKIIGDTFMRVSQSAIASFQLHENNTLLAQGTLRPDLIESASHLVSSNADVIKTHHNDTDLVRKLRSQGRIIEPLKDYHKDEVRQLGIELGLPHDLVWRQPFPGPGLAIRIICAEQAYQTDNDEEIIKALHQYQTETIQPTLLPCRTVGVQGDSRSYSAVVALSCDGEPDWTALFDIAKNIPKRVHGVNRVVYAFGPKIPHFALTSITSTTLTRPVIEQLQAADDIVNTILIKDELIRTLSQVPVILFPVDFGIDGARAICIRTFITNDFMTGVPAVPGLSIPLSSVQEMVEKVSRLPGIARVCFDLTSKPPATTEWE